MEKIGDRIKKLRTKAKITQSGLGEILGVTASAIGMYEQNRRDPQYEYIQQMSKLFNTTSDYILFGEESEMLESKTQYRTKANDDLEDIIDRLSFEKGLMFKGELVVGDDLEKVIEAMKIGAEIALKGRK